MSALAALKLVAVKRPSQLSPVMHRRNKVIRRIAEQIELANAQNEGREYAPTRTRTVRNKETGETKTAEVTKRVKAWWWVADSGKLCLSLRFGAKVVEISKGKGAIEVANPAELVTTLTVLRDAVMNGELDAQLAAVSDATRAAFKK